MKLSQVKKIDDKEYKIEELTVQEIITLINDASFFQKQNKELEETKETKETEELKIEDVSETLVINSILAQLEGFNLAKKDLENMMKLCCDFELKDLIPLAPSEIKELITVFREVNAPFLSVLESLQIPQILKDLWEVYLMGFSKKLAI